MSILITTPQVQLIVYHVTQKMHLPIIFPVNVQIAIILMIGLMLLSVIQV